MSRRFSLIVLLCSACVDYSPVPIIEEEKPPLPKVNPYQSSDVPQPLPDAAPNCYNTKPIQATTRLFFEAVEPGCDWSVDGNLRPEDGYLTARSEQHLSIDLSSYQDICEIWFDFDPDRKDQSMVYDDELFFTLNDIVLLASDKTQTQRLTTDGLFHFFDWDVLAGTPINFATSVPPYCVGEEAGWATCDLPAAHLNGQIELEMNDYLTNEISDYAINHGALDFALITVGDNDPEDDCSHTAFTFEVIISAVPK